MKRNLIGLALVAAMLVCATPVRAREPADRGVSFAAWAGAAVDRTVTTVDGRRPVHDSTPIFGVTGLGNLGRLAIGASIDGTPVVLDSGRLSMSALVGWQPQLGETRIQLLGEAGSHRLSEVDGGRSARQLGPDPWLPYAGVRLGAMRTFPAHGVFEIGLWLFGRYDVGQRTVTYVSGSFEETRTDHRVGGFMGGLAFQAGLRLEGPHPWNEALGAR